MKRLFVTIVTLCAATLGCWANVSAGNHVYGIDSASVSTDSVGSSGDVYEGKVDANPEFPGGVPALMQYLTSNLKYPSSAQKAGVAGRVLVQFVVDTEGKICDPHCLNSIHKDLDAEAVRVVKAMPKWKPGNVKGNPVRVKFTLPINFSLNRNDAKRPGGQMPPRMGGPRTTAVFGVYKKGKNRGGFDEYMLGVKDKMHQTVRLTVNYNVRTQSDELSKEIAQRVFGVREEFEAALKTFHKSFDEVKIEECKTTVSENETEYSVSQNGVVGVEYRSLIGVTNLQKLPAMEYMLFDINTNKVVTLADLVTPALGDYLKEKGVDVEKTTNISIKDKGFVAVTSFSAITIDGEKLKDKLTDYALQILEMER